MVKTPLRQNPGRIRSAGKSILILKDWLHLPPSPPHNPHTPQQAPNRDAIEEAEGEAGLEIAGRLKRGKLHPSKPNGREGDTRLLRHRLRALARRPRGCAELLQLLLRNELLFVRLYERAYLPKILFGWGVFIRNHNVCVFEFFKVYHN